MPGDAEKEIQPIKYGMLLSNSGFNFYSDVFICL